MSAINVTKEGEYEIFADKNKRRLGLLVCFLLSISLGMICGGLAMCGIIIVKLVMFFAISTFVTVVGVIGLFLPQKPILRINDKGIIQGSFNVAWDEIKEVKIVNISFEGSTQRLICVYLKDEKAFISQLPFLRRVLIACSPRLSRSQSLISIQENSLPGRAQELIDIFNIYLKNQLRCSSCGAEVPSEMAACPKCLTPVPFEKSNN